jgi:hypothetical protein
MVFETDECGARSVMLGCSSEGLPEIDELIGEGALQSVHATATPVDDEARAKLADRVRIYSDLAKGVVALGATMLPGFTPERDADAASGEGGA